MPFRIVRDDLAHVRADAIVIPANEYLVVDGGTALAVAKEAGLWRVRRACKKIGYCACGHAVATPAFKLSARCLVHAVGPIWRGVDADKELLRSAYESALSCALQQECESVALPLLSAGVRACPVDVSLDIALRAIREALEQHELDVTLVLYDRKALAAGLREYPDIQSFIDDTYVEEHRPSASAAGRAFSAAPMSSAAPSRPREPRFGAPAERPQAADMAAGSMDALESVRLEPEPWPAEDFRETASLPAYGAGVSLEERLSQLDAGFRDTLFALIDEHGMKDSEVYKRANMSRQHFAKIRKDPAYQPTKRTVFALAVALQLDLPATQDLLARAGFALSHASKFDVILEYFITAGIFDSFEINKALYAFDQQLLG